MAASPANYTGATGRSYAFKQLIQERPYIGRVWLARSDEENFVVKDIPENIFTAFESGTRAQIKAGPHLRLPIDSIPGQRIFVYRFFTEDLLTLVKNQIPLEGREEILKASLQGLADLHGQDVVHLDVKLDNVMVDFHGTGSELVVEKAQLTDLENSAYLPKGRCIKGMLPGNDNWRSPEGHLRAELNKPTDIFSFGAMCIYAVLGRVIFGPDEDMRKYTDQGALAPMVRLQRQVSYFGDRDGINGLLTHVGDDELSLQLPSNAYDGKDDDDHGYKHFSTWPEVKDDTFQHLVLSMMSLDPKRRITAKQALEHPWFKSVRLR
ncbi:kinase domain-containing protein [Phaeosphaeriaceae sp. PMI808]|nr:kinase domain-containing protein [Phaeosphaeriaceae sp. PMI808]